MLVRGACPLPSEIVSLSIRTKTMPAKMVASNERIAPGLICSTSTHQLAELARGRGEETGGRTPEKVDEEFLFFFLHPGTDHRVEFDRRRVLAGRDRASQGLGDRAHVMRASATADPDVVDAQRLRPPGVVGHLEAGAEEGLESDGENV